MCSVVTLKLLDGRAIASNHTGAGGLTYLNRWDWVLDHLTAEFDCERDEICILEADECQPIDLIVVRGDEAAYLEERVS